jgi:hypothetical protein
MGEDAVLMGGDFDGCGVRRVGRFLFPEAQVLESEILGRYPHGRVPGVEKGDDSIFLPAAVEGEEAELFNDNYRIASQFWLPEGEE